MDPSPPTPPLAQAGAWTIPGFEIAGRAGAGGFGDILLARRVRDGREAAVKVARADLGRARAQLAREAEALRALGAPVTPEWLADGELADGVPWLAMERIPGPSLADRLRCAGGRLPANELWAIARALAESLAALHGRGWAHCDLKPGHVFLAEPAVRLVDFGLSGRPAVPIAAPLGAGSIAGTAAYMAPEQVRGDPPDARADVYALGAILYELATGAPPFTGAPGEVRQAHLALRPPRPSDRTPVPGSLEELILRCLAKAPSDRPHDGSAVRELLRTALAVPTQARGARRPGAAALPRRTVGLLRIAGSVDALALSRAIEAAGGRLAHAAGDRFAAVFEPGARDNAVRLALDGAAALSAAGLAPAAVVDLATLPVIESPTGARWLVPAERPEEAVRPGDGAPVLLTARAAAAVPDASTVPWPARPGLRVEGSTAEVGPQRSPLVGRRDLLDRLATDAAAALAARAPAIVSVTGDGGMGKTRLGAELAERLRALPGAPEVVEVRAREGVAGEDETLRVLLAWALRLPREVPDDGGRAALEAALPRGTAQAGWAPAALALGWLPADAPALRRWRAAPGALRATAVRAAGEALRARAHRRPLCILVDDAHLADAAALDALEYAALAEAEVPLFVCALARPALSAARPALGERAARTAAIELGPLAPEDAADLCRRLLLPAENVPGRAIERLVQRARCVPVLLVELVRGLRSQGLVRQRGPEGGWYVATDELDAIPDMPLVDFLAQREIAGLPEALAAHARLVALLGDEVGRAEIAGVVAEVDREGAGPPLALDPDVATRRLLELRVLLARGARVAFRHPLQREAIARSAVDVERRAVHRAAFRWYLLASSLPEAERLPRLAIHAEASGLRVEAASLWLRLAEALRTRHAYLEAEGLYTRALGQIAPEDARGRFAALRGRGLVRYRLGRYEDAITDLVAAGARARSLGDASAQVECLLDEATALDWMNDFPRSIERVEAAESLAGPTPDALAVARLELARGRSHFRNARMREGDALLASAAARAEALGDDGYETLVVALLMRGATLPHLGRIEEAEQALDRALALANARGDALHVAAAHNNRRNVWVAKGNVERAVEDLGDFLKIGRDLGMVGIEYVGEFNLGELLYQAADAAAARAHVTRAVEIERRHPEVAARPLARLLAARLAAWEGDLAAARARLDEVHAFEAEARAAGRVGALLGPSDRILAEMVALAVANPSASPEAWAALRARSRAESVEQEPIEVHEQHGLAALRAGRLAEAREALAVAQALAAAIPNVMAVRLRAAVGRTT